MKDRIYFLKSELKRYDELYRTSNNIVPDHIYNTLEDELITLIGEDDEFFHSSVKTEEAPSIRKEKLPYGMYSMNKCKIIEEILKWLKTRNIPLSTIMCITPKYDGMSLLKCEKTKRIWTRGKEENIGLRSDSYKVSSYSFDCDYTYGEAIISRKNYDIITESFDGESARNAVSGLFRRDYLSDELDYVDFIRYGAVGTGLKYKNEILDYLNSKQEIKVSYKLLPVKDITHEVLYDLFVEWCKDYDIDGLIIEINDITLQESLGKEKNNNPRYARAYKGNFEEVKESTVRELEYNISKNGYIIPVAIFDTIQLDKANTSRATLNNMLFLKEMGIGVGSEVKVRRSGMVIPEIIEVITKKDFVFPPYECEWEGVHLKTKHKTKEQEIKTNLFFFRTIGVENVSIKTIEQLYESGFTTIKQILDLKQEDYLELEGFKDRKASRVFDCIQEKLGNIPLAKLQHATGLFKNLGSKKLELLKHFSYKPTLNTVLEIPGFSNILAENYINGYDEFFDFIKTIPVTYVVKEDVEGGVLSGKTFVFTGFRDKDAEDIIISKGGKIGSSVSSNTNYLIMKEKGSGSSKEKKALDLGVIIFNRDELNEFIK